MPMYKFECVKCKHEFTEMNKIDDRRKPIDEPCPECKELGGIESRIGKLNIVSGITSRLKKPTWFTDKIKEIKKDAGKGHTLDGAL